MTRVTVSSPGAREAATGTTLVQQDARPWLECVVNVSEGRDGTVLATLASECAGALLDVHRDADHNRSVFTLAGPPQDVFQAACSLATAAVARVDLRRHEGAHPRLGAVDVVPFVQLQGLPLGDDEGLVGPAALDARGSFGEWAAAALGLPVFFYGPDRALPEVRRRAWRDLEPDIGPGTPHPTAGAVCVGARPLLVAYNVWLEGSDLAAAKAVAAKMRTSQVRALGMAVGGAVQVSFNLVAPWHSGPAEVWDAVAASVPAHHGELVGLLPSEVLHRIPEERWERLGLSEATTIESALGRRGVLLGGGDRVGAVARNDNEARPRPSLT
ncbi:MAG TPA: hypothetical protein VFN61_15565 [Acidimicrobiales bacterium]|nr:hypothetical protein [Acidimicrobiales bacterium]